MKPCRTQVLPRRFDHSYIKPEAQHLININNKDASCTWPDLGVGGFAFEVVCGVCVEILFRGVCETMSSRRHPRNKLPRTQVRVSQTALRNLKVELAKSKSRFW